MNQWGDDWEEIPQSSRAGKSKTFDGLDDIVEDYNAESSSMPKAKKHKKDAAIKRKKSAKAPQSIENQDEPVRDSWVKVPRRLFEQDRLVFNPYAFPHSTCPDDFRFYCKMHAAVFYQRVDAQKNAHVPTNYFNPEDVRSDWPDVMEVMDFHQISKLMVVGTPYSPDLLKQFFATVHFSTKPKRTMTWMCHDKVCVTTLAEFGALFGIDELPVAPCYVRLHASSLIRAEDGIRHCYPPGIGLRGKIPKTVYMYPYWRVTHAILRNCLQCKFGEKGEVRERMVNCLHHIVDLFMRKKQIDILDYMWQEMRLVITRNKVPIYGPYLQTLFDTKLDQGVLKSYELYVPQLIAIPPPPPDGPGYVPPFRAPSGGGVNDDGDDEVDPKKQNIIIQALKKMNCFFAEKKQSDFKSYHKQKTASRNQRAIMDKFGIAYEASSEEVSEKTYMAKHASEYTYWFGDDASSLAPFWKGDPGQSSSGPAAAASDEGGDDEEESDDEEEDE